MNDSEATPSNTPSSPAAGDVTVAEGIRFFDSNLTIITLRYLLSLLAITGNGLILFLVYRNKRMRQSQCDIFITILAAYDMLNGVSMLVKTVHATYILLKGSRVFQRRVCTAVNVGIGYCMYGQHVVVLAIAVDRLTIVRRPLNYNPSPHRATVALFVAEITYTAFFLFCVFYGAKLNGFVRMCTMGVIAGPYLSYIAYYSHSTVVLLFATLVCLVLYGMTLFYYRSHSASIPSDAREALHQKKRRRTSAGVMILLFKYFVLWTIPACLIAAIPFTKHDSVIRQMATAVDGLFGLLNSASSVFVYLLKHEEIRNGAQRLLRRRRAESSMVTVAPAINSVYNAYKMSQARVRWCLAQSYANANRLHAT